jgi:hypothetical protein
MGLVMSKCNYCGKETKNNQKFCDRKCNDKEQQRQARVLRAQKKFYSNIRCAVCNNPILDVRRKKYCCDDCQLIGLKKAKQERENKKEKKVIIETRICKICKEKFEVHPSRKKELCGKVKCRNENQKINRKAAFDALDEKGKLEFKQKVKEKYPPIKEEFEIVLCKCPVCEGTHEHKFFPKWIGNGTPRIICDTCLGSYNVKTYYRVVGTNDARV